MDLTHLYNPPTPRLALSKCPLKTGLQASDSGSRADCFLMLSQHVRKGHRWFLPSWLAPWVDSRQIASSSQRWPHGLVPQPFSALPTLPCALCPLLSHTQPGRVRGWARLGHPAR